jgi:hypothetical protein
MADKSTARKVSKARGSILTTRERRHLELQTAFDRRTILRWERGEGLLERSRLALDAAARKMGLPVPVKETLP